MSTATERITVGETRRARRAPRETSNRKKPLGQRIGRGVLTAIAIIGGLIWLFPTYWMFNYSLLGKDQLASRTPQAGPWPPTLSHYADILKSDSFWSALRMSLLIAVLTVIVALLFAFFSALAISRFRFRGRRILIVAVLVIQMVPAEALFISQYRMLDTWHLLNSVIGMTILYVGASLPFTVWMLKGFVDGVPVELEEAAMIDGCSRMGAFFRVTFPLLGSGLVASGIFAFLAAWNEYTLALVMLTKNSSRTLPLWLSAFTGGGPDQQTDWGLIMAGATLMAIPVIILFAFVQGRMATGLVGGAVKG